MAYSLSSSHYLGLTMRLSIFIILAISVSLICGCVYDKFDFKNQTFERLAVGYSAQIQAVRYIPETGEIMVEGYDGKAQVDAMIKALGAIR